MTASSTGTPARPVRVLVITKFRGVNVGNQGLTIELIDALSENPQGTTVKYVGRSSGLNAFTLRALKQDNDPVSRFERWAKTLCESFAKVDGESGEWADDPELAKRRVGVFKAETVTGRLQPVRKLLLKPAKIMVNRYLRGSRSYAERIKTINRSDVVVYNGAGELGEHDLFVHQMLQLRVAQMMGKKVVPINQSTQLRDPVSLQILGRVYSEADSVYVRGWPSKQRLIENGVAAEKIQIAPDLVFRTQKPESVDVERAASAEGLDSPTVGLCLTRQHAESLDEWGRMIEHLRSIGREVMFVTNSPNPDLSVGRQLNRMFGVRVAAPRYGYHDYTSLLANFDFVVSSRLHTCILSSVAGVPAIPLDTRSKKLSESYDSLPGYPLETVNVFEEDWQDSLMRQMENLSNNSEEIRVGVTQATDAGARASLANVSWLWDAPGNLVSDRGEK